ncbi:MAG TPA: FtsX-like permease family protein, partial [Acidobacteriota bacterium]
PDRDPIGQRLLDSTPQWTWGADMPGAFEIVGVVRDVKFLGLDQPAEPAFYLPARQFPLAETKVLIRAAADPLELAAPARSVVRALDPDLPIAAVTTMEQLLDRALAQPRFSMLLLSLFGAVALVLAAVGLYGLLAQVVGQRSHEIGIRMALGAPPGSISRLILSEGAILTGVGLALGCAAAFLLTRLLSSMLYAVSPLDPSIFLLAALLLLAVALLTCYQPARRAQSVDPIRILRGP